jgi:site-specific recombinase XerD
LLYLIEERKVSRSSLRQTRSALRFLYVVTLRRPMEIEWVPVPRKEKRLPVVLTGAEIQSLFDAVYNPMCRAVFMTMYAAGLRISEACQLRVGDIDSGRGVIRVLGKGSPERECASIRASCPTTTRVGMLRPSLIFLRAFTLVRSGHSDNRSRRR